MPVKTARLHPTTKSFLEILFMLEFNELPEPII